MRSNTQALYRIDRWPLDLTDPIYSHYSLFKMGVHGNVRHYAEMLAPRVASLIEANQAPAGWVLTSPSHLAMPCAANLLCWCIADILKEGVANGRWPATVAPSVVEILLQYGSPPADSPNGGEYRDYSKLSLSDRVASLQGFISVADNASFVGRTIVFINDINVTGSHQRDMQIYFENAKAARVDWFYIIDVEESIGKSEPSLEHSINYVTHLSIEEFGRILAADGIRYTGKCIWRLMGHDLPDLERLFRGLGPSRRSMILQMITDEGRYGESFREKIELLRACCR
jgi:hypothetical protein